MLKEIFYTDFLLKYPIFWKKLNVRFYCFYHLTLHIVSQSPYESFNSYLSLYFSHLQFLQDRILQYPPFFLFQVKNHTVSD